MTFGPRERKKQEIQKWKNPALILLFLMIQGAWVEFFFCMREVGLAIWAFSRRIGDMPFVEWVSFSVFPFICIGNGGFNASRGFRTWTRHKAGNGMGWNGHGCLLRR